MAAAEDTAPIPEVLFEQSGGLWRTSGYGMGPFGGLHGGVVSGFLIGQMEELGRQRDWGQLVSATAYLIRPAPVEGLSTELAVLREGGRMITCENTLTAGGKLQAKASACFVREADLSGMPAEPDTQVFDPASLPRWEFEGVSGLLTYINSVDIRDDGAGTKWLRPRVRLFAETTPFANAISFADFATLFTARDGEEEPRAGGWPNADITLHVSRPPIGEWIGVKPVSNWYESGRGLTDTEIFDSHGLLGRACQSVVLLPGERFVPRT